MKQAQTGTSPALTVSEASSAIEGLLSDPSEDQETETPTPPTDESPEETADDEQPEQLDDEQESDEETDDEPSDEDGEGAGDEQEETTEQQSQPRIHKVKVDGEEIEVPEDELIKGYSRTADYTRKTQALAEKTKAFEAEANAVREERRQYAQSLKQLEEVIQSAAPAEPDWDTLRNELPPDEFAATWADWQRHEQQRQAVARERQRAEQAAQQDEAKRLQGFVEAERAKLLEELPAWKDETVAKKEKGELVEFAKSRGFTEDELGQVYDHRVITLLRDAMLHDRIQKAKPAVREKIEKVKAATPGAAGAQRRVVSEETKARQRLAKTGRIDDAARVIEGLI